MNNNELECEACQENKVEQLFGDMCTYCDAHLCQECKEYQLYEMPNCIKCADDDLDLVEPHEEEYKPYQNPTCTQPKTKIMPSGAKITYHTIKDTCEDDCCYCHDCEYDNDNYCVICGEHYEYDHNEPVRD